ncbi:alginate export family protein [Frateuria soli]|uniref:alginate export family protein n=1 Tax=Frateuria soli TaxID=1542730 RepID=UPI001E642B7A|nr:alginate export family protein [Frateuria soli]UGB39577.1 alginate export family protein [Frateuria soli]
MHTRLVTGCLLAFASTPAWSTDAPAPLQLEWDARARHEQVDNDAFARDARADTLRLRLGLRAMFGGGFGGYLEGAGVAAAGGHYDSGANGHGQYPVITDPRGSELNQAYLTWQGSTFGAIAGRQRLLFDNQRWIGNVGWRQHEQTFDAVTLQWAPTADWTVRYAWLGKVHRVAGRDARNVLARERKLDTHLLNAGVRHGRQQWSGYAYLHEDRDLATASSATYGVRWSGKPVADGFGWTLEAAHQVDYANNPQRFAHDYWLAEPAWTLHGITGRLGWEHLGGNGRHALQTPLATLHAFNGWDDQFTVTPAGGLEDRYAAVNGAFGPQARFGWTLAWHDFHADHGNRYGSEWDGSLGYAFSPTLNGLLKLASYQADGFGRDDTKLWLQVEWKGVHALR